MRRAFVAAAAAAILLPRIAWADSITSTVPVSIVGSGPYPGDIEVPFASFNGSLGTLMSETLALSGNFTPGFDWQPINDPLPGFVFPTSVPVTLDGQINLWDGGGPMPTFLPPQAVDAILSPGLYLATGTPEPVSITRDVPSEQFDTGSRAEADIPASTRPERPNWVPGVPFEDLTKFLGTLSVTYTYTPADPPGDPPVGVPEPASLALLGLGFVALVGARWA